jgi:tetratricopeptide (TPR) repeat protein
MNAAAMKALSQKALDNALESIDKAIANDPDFQEAYLNKAAILINMRRPADADAILSTLLQRKPDFAQAWLLHGIVLETMGRKEEALKQYERAIPCFDALFKKNAPTPDLQIERAVAAYLFGGKVAGFTEFNTIVEKYPTYYPALYLRQKISEGDHDFFLAWTSERQMKLAAPAAADKKPPTH